MRGGISKPVDYAGYYIPPVPFKGLTQGLHDHNAVDLRCSFGTPVVAAASGRICRTGYNALAGRYIVMEHDNGTETLYAHLSEIYWTKGHNIRQGEVIGFSGQSGNATGPHLHFAIWGHGVANPFKDWPTAG
jgi:murein DD-endopeptidase